MLNKVLLLLMIFVAQPVYADTEYDKDTLAYLEYTGDFWQVFIKKSGADAKQISSTPYDKSNISWLADGKNIFACGIQGDAEIINIEMGKSKFIKLPKKSINDAVISPDGKQILYSDIAKDSTDNKLWLYDIAEKSNKPLLTKMQGRQYDPKWGVNGDVFYFVTGIANRSYEIHQASIKTLESFTVIANSRYNLDVDASLNGKIAYSSNLKNSFDIWIKVGDEIKQLTSTDGSESRPSWSSDEGHIYFEKLNDGIINIWAINILDGQLKQVTFSETGARLPVVYKGVSK